MNTEKSQPGLGSILGFVATHAILFFIVFVCTLFDHIVRNLDWVASNVKILIYSECGRKRLQHNLWYLPGI